MAVIFWDKFATTTLNNFQSYWNQPQLTDVTLATENNEEIKAHKIILCNGSAMFQKLLYNSQDKSYFNIHEIHPTITFKELETIVKFIYLGKCEMESSELESILSVGRDLGIIGLTESRQDFLLSYPCSMCEYKSIEYSSLTKHIKNIHTEIKYTCNHCEYNATKEHKLTDHIKIVHMTEGYCCDHCEFITTKANNINGHKRPLSKEVKTRKKREKIDCGSDKVIDGNCFNKDKNPEEMTIDEIEEELQTYIVGDTKEERTKYRADARKRARDRIVKACYRDVKKPGRVEEIVIMIDMLENFRKKKTNKTSVKRKMKTDSEDIDQNKKASKRPRKTEVVSEEPSRNIHAVKDDKATNNQEDEAVNNITVEPQEVVCDITSLVNKITTNPQESHDICLNIPEEIDIIKNPQELYNVGTNICTLNYINEDPQKILDIDPNIQAVNDNILEHSGSV